MSGGVMGESLPTPDKDAGLHEQIKAECERIMLAADEYDRAGQHEYAGGLRESAHHVFSLLGEITAASPIGSCPHCSHTAAYCKASSRGCCRECRKAKHTTVFPSAVTPPEVTT